MVLNYTTNSRWIFDYHIHGERIISFKNILDEAVEMINFMKFQTLNTCLFNILCDEMGRMDEVISTVYPNTMIVLRKSKCAIV